MTVLQIKDLRVDAVDRRGSARPIVEAIGFTVQAGKVIALIGESGSGKTTIALATMAYARPGCRITGGEVILDEQPLLQLGPTARQRIRGTDIAYIAQSAAGAFNGALTIGAQVTEIPILRGLLSRPEAEQRAVELYRQLDLPEPERIGGLYPHQVSGGQLQRLLAAMAMICRPKLLILDEPTTALDVTTQIEVLQAFKRLIRSAGTAAIYVSHDLAVVTQMADEILVLKDGVVVEHGATEQIIHRPRADYTRTLIAAAPKPPRPTAGAEVASTRPAPLLAVQDVTAAYGRNRQTALKNVSLAVNPGETVGVIGESGSGKTTLGRVISGLMTPSAGRIELSGQVLKGDLRARTRAELQQVQFVFQMADLALNPRQRIVDILTRPLVFYLGLNTITAADRARELLALVDLSEDLLQRFPHELSGGQKQRVNFARALAAEPKLIICDEITSALDTLVAAAIIELLRRLQQQLGIAYLFISHDLSTVADFADAIAVMRFGEIVEFGATDAVLSPPCHRYTEQLLRSIPELRQGWLEGVAGTPGAQDPRARR